jgi:hypothetical protein
MKSFWTIFAALIFGGTVFSQKAVGATPSPLPPIETVIQRVEAAAETEGTNDTLFDHRYFYTRDKVTEFFNSDGHLIKRDEKQNTNDPLRKLTISRPKLETPRSDPAAENQRPTETQSDIHGRQFQKKDILLNPDLLKRFTFTMVGREMLDGRPALVVDFKPASDDLPVHSIKDKFINVAAGRVWIDEGDYTLTKADLHLTQRVNVFGGLVGAVWKFSYSFDRARTADGLWFTRDVDWHLEGREVFIPRSVDYHEQLSNLKKLQ